MLKVLFIEVFKLYKIKETKHWLLPNQYVKSRENVIGGCAITRDTNHSRRQKYEEHLSHHIEEET